MPTEIEAFDALMRSNLRYFTRKAFKTVDPGAEFLPNWHIDLIAEYLEACTRREIKRLIINMPPRYMKSISVSVAWPAWLLGSEPARGILAASYADDLSIKLSVDTRLVVESSWYKRAFPKFTMAPDQNEKSKFQSTLRGHRSATTVGGAATGLGGDFLIVDDPINPKKAASKKTREDANTWFDQTFYSRLNDKKNGVIVVVMQRLHDKDLTGHLLDKGGWEQLILPAEAEKKQIISFGSVHVTREVGDLLHPEREGPKEIEAVKVALGSYGYASQYQQRPAPDGGGVFKLAWFKRYREKPADIIRIVQSWDTAYKPDQLNDPSVCLTIGETRTGAYILDVYRDRLTYPQLRGKSMALAAKWNPGVILIEDKASGQSLIQDLRADTMLPVLATDPTGEGDKLVRASTVSPKVEAGRVWLPESATWLHDFEQELILFPNAENDDQVDALSQYLNWSGKPAHSVGVWSLDD